MIQSWRNRSTRERIPLPMLLICFCLLADAMTVLGRSAVGLDALVNSNRYMLPNQILLVAIIMYAWAHLPNARLISRERLWRASMTWLALFLLGILVVAQVSISTSFGLANGRAENHFLTQQARLLINLGQSARPGSFLRTQRRTLARSRSPRCLHTVLSGSWRKRIGLASFSPTRTTKNSDRPHSSRFAQKAGGSAPPF